jgi:hypothetical protein
VIEVLLEAERALSFGLLDQAERLYRQASHADPRNSIAVVGLARVALERGDEELALSEAERALTIDGENEAARRMAERLREVRDHRAATAPEPEPATPEPEGSPDTAAPEAPAPEPPVSEPLSITRTAESEATVAPAPTPEPDTAPEPAPEPARRGGFVGWLLRLFGRR